jgi:hypothetical protein
MRLKSEIWAKAYLRRCAQAGAMAVQVRRGDTDAGAIYIKVARLDGTAELYGPAPSGFGPDDDAQQRWQACFARGAVAEAEADQYLARQVEFDSDIWILSVEDRDGRHFLDDWLVTD